MPKQLLRLSRALRQIKNIHNLKSEMRPPLVYIPNTTFMYTFRRSTKWSVAVARFKPKLALCFSCCRQIGYHCRKSICYSISYGNSLWPLSKNVMSALLIVFLHKLNRKPDIYSSLSHRSISWSGLKRGKVPFSTCRCQQNYNLWKFTNCSSWKYNNQRHGEYCPQAIHQ